MRARRAFSWRAVVVVAVALGWLPFFAGIASAHAQLKSSDPKANATLQQPPSQIVATFTEPPDPKLSHLHVLNSTGSQVDTAPTQGVPGKPLELRLALPQLPKGTYTVTWQTVSETDGHLTGDTFAFGVGVKPAPVKPGGPTLPSTPSPSVASVAGKWMLYAGVSVLFASGAVGPLAFAGNVPGGRRTVGASWIVAALGYVLMVVAEHSTLGISLGTLLGSAAGRPLVELGIAIAAAGVLVAAWIARPGRATAILLALATAAVMLVRVLGGHAAAAQTFTWFNEGTQWLHLLGVGTWIGGLVLLLIALIRGGLENAAVRRFSTIAGIALAVVATTGLLRAVDELGGWGTWRRLIDTSFGITLAIKVGLFLVLVALGAWNRYVNVPNSASRARSLRRVVTAEVVVAAGVFGLTGVLTGLPPAANAAGAPAPSGITVSGSDFATSVRVQLTVDPGIVGPNEFRTRVVDYDTGKPVPATRVTLAFALPSHPEVSTTLNLKEAGAGVWTGSGSQLSIGGRWDVMVTVQEPSTSTDVALHVQTKTPPQQLSVTQGSNGVPDIYTVTEPDGSQIQMYVDPGSPGKNEFHITAFEPSGKKELQLRSASAEAVSAAGSVMKLPTRRLDPIGHYVADATLSAGSWTFNVSCVAKDGTVLSAHFTQAIG